MSTNAEALPFFSSNELAKASEAFPIYCEERLMMGSGGEIGGFCCVGGCVGEEEAFSFIGGFSSSIVLHKPSLWLTG